MDYIDLDYEPKKEELVAEYYLKPAKNISIKKAAENIAKESSVGTWTTISTMNESIANKLKPHVYDIKKKGSGAVVKIAYSSELFETGSIPQIFSSIAGNIFGMKLIEDLRLIDIDFSDKLMKSFKGPQVGMKGIKKMMNVKDRPLVGTIVKPKLGLNSKQHAEVAYNAWKGGLDLVKDDENLTSMSFNPFKRRVEKTLKLREKAEKQTGDRKEYMPNITAPVSKMKERADYVIERGSNYVMIDILTVGWSALQEMRDYLEGKDIAIHCHRAGHAAFTRKSNHGISMYTVAKVTRMIGGDQLHIGTANVGKMKASQDEVLEIEKCIESENVEEHNEVLKEEWLGKKKTLAVASGGLHPGSIPSLIDRMGTDIVAQFGGGCHGHPDGTEAGARAVRQALEATLDGIDLKEYGKSHEELKKAIEKWGIE